MSFLKELVNPSRTARAVPLGRLSIVTVFLASAIFVGYTLAKMSVSLPFTEDRYELKAEFLDAAGLDAENNPPVSVAGVPVGRVTGVVARGGRGIATLQLSEDARGKVFRDATVRVRPLNGANILTVNIEPGHPRAGALPDGATVPAAQTRVPVASDRMISVLDADTRAWLEVLTVEMATALKGRGGEIANALRRLGPFTDSAREISALMRQRRRMIKQLVGETTEIFATLARRRSDLAAVVHHGTRILGVTGARRDELAASLRELPRVLADADAMSTSLLRSSPVLREALVKLAPALRGFTVGMRDFRAAMPAVNRLFAAVDELTRDTRAPARDLQVLTRNLGTGLDSAIAGTEDFTAVVKGLADHGPGLKRTAEVASGLLSTQDPYGVLGRLKLIGVEVPRPEAFGLPARAGKVRGDGHSRLELLLARALRRRCKTNALACVVQAATPGLPGSAVPRRKGGIPGLVRVPGGGR